MSIARLRLRSAAIDAGSMQLRNKPARGEKTARQRQSKSSEHLKNRRSRRPRGSQNSPLIGEDMGSHALALHQAARSKGDPSDAVIFRVSETVFGESRTLSSSLVWSNRVTNVTGETESPGRVSCFCHNSAIALWRLTIAADMRVSRLSA
jgi:hypothetical protein